MLPLSKTLHHPPQTSLWGRLSLVALLLLLTPACFAASVEDFCVFTDYLEWEVEGTSDETVDISLIPRAFRRFKIDIAEPDSMEVIRRTINPVFALKSIRLVSLNDAAYLFKKLEMVLHPPENSSRPATTIIERDAPIVSWPVNQIYIQTNPTNILDYIDEDGNIDTEITIQLKTSLESLLLSVEVCVDGKLSFSIASLPF